MLAPPAAKLGRVACPLLVALLCGAAAGAQGEPAESEPAPGALEVVVTTATKKGEAEIAQGVPAAISVLSTEALAERRVTDLEDLSYALPNVALDGIGTGKGIANFSIRGLGIAGSIPSIDPTVGVFVDGIYLGVNYGVVVDMLDLESAEILRGPQGLLFGRNVIGGAVLLRSRRPSGGFGADAAVRVETGLDRRVTASVENAFADGRLGARLAVGLRDDAGWFDNRAPGGGAVGAERTQVVRPVLAWTPSDATDVTLIVERGSTNGDGPATQNRRRFGGFGFAIDEPGFSRIDWRHAVVEANRRVDLGNGQVSSIVGWRTVDHASLADIDSTPDPIFHLFAYTDQEQASFELRYAGWPRGAWHLTAGVYFFAQEIGYRERRIVRGTRGGPFGGEQRHRTGGAFVSNDIELGGDWLLTVGARYTVERKDVDVATAGRNACVSVRGACRWDFQGGDSWRNVTPKAGIQRSIGPDTLIYGHYTRGFRSGGYNLRNTSPTALPGPFDEEEQDAFEAGVKAEFADRRARLNVAAFHTKVTGMQRQVTRIDLATGGIQITANTADAVIHGVEAELLLALGESLRVEAFAGVADGGYTRVLYDLDGDGSTAGDERFDLPRLAPLTYGASASLTRHLGRLGLVTTRLAVSYRDDSEISDDNSGVLDGGHLLDASVEAAPSDRLAFTLYGRNLTGTVLRRSDADLTGLVDSTYSPLKEGRVVGVEIRYSR